MKFMHVVFLALFMTMAVPAIAQEGGTSNMDILREKVKADKKLIVAANMQLTDAEGKTFWPIYEDYQNDLKKINAQMGKVILAYAEAYKKDAVTDEVARGLMNDALAVEESELQLKRAYLPKIEKSVGAVKAARYIQIENKIRAAIKYELAGDIPLVK
jgi:hypothetical protein